MQRFLFVPLVVAAAILLGGGIALAGTGGETKMAKDVTAIDILLEPDATMLQHAAANNARLLDVFPGGFALDATHAPHITMIQRLVRTADLPKVYAAAEHVIVAADVRSMSLEAFKYYCVPAGKVGVAGIVARSTPGLIRLQANPIAAIAPSPWRQVTRPPS